MNEREKIDKIKELSQDLKIPDSLSKNNIIDKLDKKGKTKNYLARKRMYQYAAVAAVILCFILTGAVFPIDKVLKEGETEQFHSDLVQKIQEENQIETQIETQSDFSTVAEQTSNMDERIAKDYKSVYKALKTSYKSSKTRGVEDGAVLENMKESAENSSINDLGKFSDTNLQVQGVEEGDCIKTDGNYIYYLRQNVQQEINIFKAEEEKVKLLSTISSEEEYFLEFYVIEDKLIIISQKQYNTKESLNKVLRRQSGTYVLIYDISDRSNPKLKETIEQDGYYGSSRVVEDYLYFITYYNIYSMEDVKRKETSAYIPYVNGSVLEADCILIPEEIDTTNYCVISSIDLKNTEKVMDTKAVLSNAGNVYVSNSNIYIYNAIRNGTNENTMLRREIEQSNTEILKLEFKDGKIIPKETAIVEGQILDTFAIDEYDGYLRVLTTVTEYKTAAVEVDDKADKNSKATEDILNDFAQTVETKQKNQVYVLNEQLQEIGKIDDLAEGERIYSARFMGDTAYFVTFRQVDPLFSVDFFDPSNPKIIGKLKIPGFSEYLHFYNDNLLLGIGLEADKDGTIGNVKLSMFDISDPSNVIEKDKFVLEDVESSPALYDYKSVLIDTEENIFGFSVQKNIGTKENMEYITQYMTFSYDEIQGFQNTLTIQLKDYSEARGLYIGSYLYIVDKDTIKVYHRTTFKKENEINY